MMVFFDGSSQGKRSSVQGSFFLPTSLQSNGAIGSEFSNSGVKKNFDTT